jgi:hypothetical protein
MRWTRIAEDTKDICKTCGQAIGDGMMISGECESCARKRKSSVRTAVTKHPQCICGHYHKDHEDLFGKCRSCKCPRFE